MAQGLQPLAGEDTGLLRNLVPESESCRNLEIERACKHQSPTSLSRGCPVSTGTFSAWRALSHTEQPTRLIKALLPMLKPRLALRTDAEMKLTALSLLALL